MNKIYTVGFTKKTAEDFFNALEENRISLVLDLRLNNTSQLAGFTKYPDIKFFLNRICKIDYIHDTMFSPTDYILSRYKKKEIDWGQYEKEFFELMRIRNINKYIPTSYSIDKTICLLCSEPTPEKCHRRLIANIFKEVLSLEIIHL